MAARRCHYEVLGLHLDCTADEIRSAYRKLALQLHPDKLARSGVSEADATASFQELSHAYEVLSDPKERSWYDSHRSQILFSDPSSASNSLVPDLFSFFSNAAFSGFSSDHPKGFFRVYSAVFDRIYANELDFARKLGLGSDSVRDAPVMGDLASPYSQATAFYGYWLGFSTVMDFCWADVYDAAGGVNRKSRRVMEEENKKARRKARREYNETVRGLAEFAKKRDKRVIDMAVKRSEEMEKRKAEERERRRKEERERVQRAMAFEEPEWAAGPEEEEEEVNTVEETVEERKEEFYCVVCGKKFRSEKQWKNHEQSKKHREKVAELREEIEDEEDNDEEDEVEELGEYFSDGVRIGDEEVTVKGDEKEQGEENGDKGNEDDGERGEEVGANGVENVSETGEENSADGSEKVGENGHGNVEDDISVLEAMLGGRRNRKKAPLKPMNTQAENDSDEMEYNSRKTTRKNRRAKKEKSGKNSGNGNADKDTVDDDGGSVTESNSRSNAETEPNPFTENIPASNRKGIAKNSSKGKKAKGASKKYASITCEKCEEEFESKTKLHKHLSDTGHASLKHR